MFTLIINLLFVKSGFRVSLTICFLFFFSSTEQYSWLSAEESWCLKPPSILNQTYFPYMYFTVKLPQFLH